MDKTELLDAFAQQYGRPAPQRMRRDLLRVAIAYRLQEQAAGGQEFALNRRLDRLVETLRKTGQIPVEKRAFKPGTRLLREWKGETHQVTVLDQGFWYRGVRYRSLSVIARLITGARWSGPTFFGLNDTHE